MPAPSGSRLEAPFAPPSTRPGPSRLPLGPTAIPGLRSAFHRLGALPDPGSDAASLDTNQIALTATRSVLARAVPFLVPHEQSAMVCDSESPDPAFFEDAHLPYPAVSLWFARPVELAVELLEFGHCYILGVAVVANDPAGTGIAAPAAWLCLVEDDGRERIATFPVATWRASAQILHQADL